MKELGQKGKSDCEDIIEEIKGDISDYKTAVKS